MMSIWRPWCSYSPRSEPSDWRRTRSRPSPATAASPAPRVTQQPVSRRTGNGVKSMLELDIDTPITLRPLCQTASIYPRILPLTWGFTGHRNN
jgi:hypothetical protein